MNYIFNKLYNLFKNIIFYKYRDTKQCQYMNVKSVIIKQNILRI